MGPYIFNPDDAYRFAREMGVSPAYISNMENGYAKICHAKIRETFPDY